MRKLLIVLVLAALGSAGCGGGGGGDVDVASKKTSGATSGDATATSTAGGDASFTGKGGKAFCDYLKELSADKSSLSLGNGENTKENRAAAAKAVTVLDKLQDKAPAELSADVKVVVSQLRPYLKAYADAKDGAAVKTPAEPSGADQKAFEDASNRVDAYSKNVCGIKADDATTGDTATDGSSDGQAPADTTVDGSGGDTTDTSDTTDTTDTTDATQG